MGAVMRAQDWDIRLAQAINDRRDTQFVWGKNDCCLFAADCAIAMTGTDFAREFRGKYDSAFSAARQIAQRGGFRAMISGLLGAEIPLAMAQRGDVVMIEQDGQYALAICDGARLAAAGPDGLVWLAASAGITAWRVE